MRSQDLLKTPEHAFHSHSGYCMLYTRTILLPVVEGVISHVMLTHHRIDMNTAGLWLALCRCQTPVLPMPQFRLPGHWAILRHTKAALATLKKWIQARYLCQFAFEVQVSNKNQSHRNPNGSQWLRHFNPLRLEGDLHLLSHQASFIHCLAVEGLRHRMRDVDLIFLTSVLLEAELKLAQISSNSSNSRSLHLSVRASGRPRIPTSSGMSLTFSSPTNPRIPWR